MGDSMKWVWFAGAAYAVANGLVALEASGNALGVALMAGNSILAGIFVGNGLVE